MAETAGGIEHNAAVAPVTRTPPTPQTGPAGGAEAQEFAALISASKNIPNAGVDAPTPARGTAPTLNPVRTQAAVDMADRVEGGHYQAVKSIAIAELQYATRNDAIPRDRLDELVGQLKARHSDDKHFIDAIDWAAEELGGTVDPATGRRVGGLWESLGRSHAVFDPVSDALAEARRSGDMGKLRSVVLSQFENLARVDSTATAIESRRDLLLRFGPADTDYRLAVRDAAEFFLQGRPDEIAEAVRTEFDQNGASAAARMLREQVEGADPVTAGLALTQSLETMKGAITAFMESPFTPPMMQSFYNDLSVVADVAGRNQTGGNAVGALADALTDVFGADFVSPSGAGYIRNAVTEGHGALLATEIARRVPTEDRPAILEEMEEGLGELEDGLREKVQAFTLSAMSVTEPAQNWGPPLGPERAAQAGEAWESDPPDFVNRANADSDALDRLTGQYVRTRTVIEEYLRELEDNGAGDHDPHTQELINKFSEHVKTSDKDPLLQYAVQFSRAAFEEALRTMTTGASDAAGPYTPQKLQELIDTGIKELESGQGIGRILAYAQAGILPSFFILSRVRFRARRGDARAIALLPEQFLRDSFVRLTLGGGEDRGETPPLELLKRDLVLAGITDLITTGTNTAQNQLVNRVLQPNQQLTNMLTNRWSNFNWDNFKIPGHLLVGRLAIPPLIAGFKAGFNGLEKTDLGNKLLPEDAPTGPDGKPQYDNIRDWLYYQWPEVTSVSIPVGIGAGLIGTYEEGLVLRYDNAPGGPVQRPKLWQAARAGTLWTNLRAGGGGTFLSGSAYTAGIVALQYLGAEALFNHLSGGTRTDLPPPQSNLFADHGAEWLTSMGSVAAAGYLTGPVGLVAGFALYLGGQLIQNQIDKARRTSQFEGPTQSYLDAAGIDPEIATILADYDGQGYDVASRLTALAEYRGVTPRELLRHIEKLKPEEVRTLVDAMHAVKPNEAGNYPVSGKPEDAFSELLDYGERVPQDRRYLLPSQATPATIQALNWWVDRFLPGFPEAEPVAPPDIAIPDHLSAEYQEWLDSPGGQAWQAIEDMNRLAEALDLPN